MSHVMVPGGKLFYEVKGEGETLVMVRGLGRLSDHWLGYDDQLSKDFQVITFDARGLGRSKDVKVSWLLTVKRLAEDVIAILDKENISSCHIFGVSLGGMVAMSLAIHFPHRIRSITLANSSIGGKGQMRLSPAALYKLSKGMAKKGNIHSLLAEVLVSSGYEHSEKMVEEWKQIGEEFGFGEVTILKQLIAAGLFMPQKKLKKLQTPTLVIAGDDDQFVPIRNSELIHELIPGSEYKVIEGGGHEIMTDQGEAVKLALKDFVAKH